MEDYINPSEDGKIAKKESGKNLRWCPEEALKILENLEYFVRHRLNTKNPQFLDEMGIPDDVGENYLEVVENFVTKILDKNIGKIKRKRI